MGFEIFIPNVFFKNTSKKISPAGDGHSGRQNETVPERGKSQITYTEFEIFDPNVFFKNTSKNICPTRGEDSGCQNETVPELSLIHI